MLKPMWDAKAVKAYESGQGVKLVSTPHPHYEPLPDDLNPESLEAVEIDLPPQRTWVGLTPEEIVAFDDWYDNREEEKGWVPPEEIVAYIEAKLRSKNNA